MQRRISSHNTDRRLGQATWLLFASLAIILPAATGCAKKRDLAPVSGKVTLNGKPLTFGTIMLQAAGGQPAAAKIKSDGTFDVSTYGEGGGAPVGQLKVRVRCFEAQGPTPPKDGTRGASLIPMKYTSYDTSGLTLDLKAGEAQELNIELTDP